jgi:hypothetical protein
MKSAGNSLTGPGTSPVPERFPPELDSYSVLHRACGCGITGARDFQPGHNIRAINESIRTRFGGSALKYLQWVDAVMVSTAAVAGQEVGLMPRMQRYWWRQGTPQSR